jgi:integrative and conjugative element protein (TIGR02256 family)
MTRPPVGLLVDRSVLDITGAKARAEGFNREVGGVLIGYRRGSYLHVSGASVPQVRDHSSRFRFHRLPDGHQAFVDAAWRRSKGHEAYLGEWHSHPENLPTPSGVDRASWATTLARHGRPLVFLIVGRTGLWLSVAPVRGPLTSWRQIEEDADGGLFAPATFKV